MSRDCNDCEYFEGWSNDGIKTCSREREGGVCPYNNEADFIKNGAKIEIDTDFLTEYIRSTIQNTVHTLTQQIVEREISKIIDKTYKDKIQSITEEAIRRIVNLQVMKFMSGDITIGGGWREPERTLSRTAYMSELVEKELGEKFNSASMKDTAAREAKNAIDRFAKDLKNEINSGVKQYFDAATRQTLTDNVVSMLMNNDTYKRLSESMKTFLPDKTT